MTDPPPPPSGGGDPKPPPPPPPGSVSPPPPPGATPAPDPIAGAGQAPPPPPPPRPAPPPPGAAPGAAPPGPPAAPAKSSNKGCIVALVVVAILGVLAVGGSIVAITFLGRAADDTIGEALDEGIPGVVGGDCLEFQFAYSTLTMSALFTAGADDQQAQELEDSLAEMHATVPDEIADDFEIVSDAFRESMRLGIASGGLAGGTEADPDDVAEAQAVLESPEVVEAQDNIDAWLIENCS